MDELKFKPKFMFSGMDLKHTRIVTGSLIEKGGETLIGFYSRVKKAVVGYRWIWVEVEVIPETVKFITEIDKYDVIRNEAIILITNQFGNGVLQRMRKLKEEVAELDEAINDLPNRYMQKNGYSHVIDELADVNIVVTHLASLFGMDATQLLDMAIDKVRGRIVNPNYKRDGKR